MGNSQYSDWVVVDNLANTTENYSESRSPQYKEANESSQQVASTTAAQVIKKLGAAFQAKLHIGGDGYEHDYAITHKAPSNDSDATASTDITAPGTLIRSEATVTPSTYNPFQAGLTEAHLAQYQHELESLNPGDIGAWLQGAAPGFTRLAILARQKKNGGGHPARSKPSYASDASCEHVAAPNTDAGRGLDIRAAGALFNEQSSDPYLYDLHLEM
jgi:hypothetical protein